MCKGSKVFLIIYKFFFYMNLFYLIRLLAVFNGLCITCIPVAETLA